MYRLWNLYLINNLVEDTLGGYSINKKKEMSQLQKLVNDSFHLQGLSCEFQEKP